MPMPSSRTVTLTCVAEQSTEISTERALQWRCTLARDSWATQKRVSSISLGRRWKLSEMAKLTATPLRSANKRT